MLGVSASALRSVSGALAPKSASTRAATSCSTMRAQNQVVSSSSLRRGKTTLGARFSGLRAPESGLLLLDGIDLRSMGFEGWRERVGTCPQYHENHVFAETVIACVLRRGRAVLVIAHP